MDALMCECTGQCGPEVLGSIFNAVENQEEHDVDWISAITCSPHIQEIAADTVRHKETQQELLKALLQDTAENVWRETRQDER